MHPCFANKVALVFLVEISSCYMHHARTTLHSSSFSRSAVVYSNTIATATAEQRWLSSSAPHIIKVIGATAIAKVGIVISDSTCMNRDACGSTCNITESPIAM